MATQQTSSVQTRVSQALWRIPPLRGALGMLINAVGDESVNADEIAKAVSLDEMLTSQVMRAASAAALGFRSPVHTVSQAIARLGCASVHSMALAQGVAQAIPLPYEVGGVPRLKFWEHNWAVATAATLLAPAYGMDRGEAHLAALLHDVGKLVLASFMPDRYVSCMSVATREGIALSVAEAKLLGCDHAQTGETALRTWGLPESVVTAASKHHQPPRLKSLPPIAQLVQAANSVAHASGIGFSGNSAPVQLADCRAADPRLTQGIVERCKTNLAAEQARIERLATLLAGDDTGA